MTCLEVSQAAQMPITSARSEEPSVKPAVSTKLDGVAASESRASKNELPKGICITKKLTRKIQQYLRGESGAHAKRYDNCSNVVFTLAAAPRLIFKISRNPQQRYQNMINAMTAVRTHHLTQLVIPHAKLFTVKSKGCVYTIIAERKLDITPHKWTQRDYFLNDKGSLDEAIRQLTLFICKTGYSDVEWRNNPVLNGSVDEHGNRKLTLIDMEELGDVQKGLYGVVRRGLLGCTNKRQWQIVQQTAVQQRVEGFTTSEAIAPPPRETELERYYAKRGIVTGYEPIQVDVEALDFSEYPKESDKLKKLARELLATMNEEIAKSPADYSVAGRRIVYIDRNHKFGSWSRPINFTASLEVPLEQYFYTTWVGAVVKKLLDVGAIHGEIVEGEYRYLQA